MRRFLFGLLGALAMVCSPQLATAEPVHDSLAFHSACAVAPVHVVRAAPSIQFATVSDSTRTVPLSPLNPLALLGPGLIGLAFMGSINDTTADDRDSYPSRQGVRQQLDNAIRDIAYLFTHRPAWQVAAAAVAPPVVATATVTTQVKTTATTQLMVNGVLTSLTATDPFVLAADIALGDPNTLAIGSVRKWQICWDATNATTKGTVRPSNDQIIANFASSAVALAACRWTSLPPRGTVIVGVASIVNLTSVFTPGTTLLGAAGVTATYVDGPTQDCLLASLVSP